MGPVSWREVESWVAARVGVPHAIAVASGAEGVRLGLLALKAGRGQEVIVPAISGVDVVAAVEQCGAVPVVVDVHPGTLLLDERQLARVLTPRTAGIIAVHLGGAPCNLDPISKVVCARRLWMIEEATAAMGARFKGRPVGADDRLGVFELGRSVGDGSRAVGVVVTRDADLAAALRVWAPGDGALPDSGTIDELEVSALEAGIEHRRTLASVYDERLAEAEGVTPLGVPHYDHRHARSVYLVRTDDSCRIERDLLRARLAARGVETGVSLVDLWAEGGFAARNPAMAERLPVAAAVSNRVFSLPLSRLASAAVVIRVVEVLRAALAA
jgi:dTDP-4-amino-4,6-dideoxygalactose transaminase